MRSCNWPWTHRRRRPAQNRVYPETKHPAHFRALGLPQEAAVLETLARYGYDAPGSPVFIQSFDPHNLMQLRNMTRLPLVQLLEHQVADLPGMAKYADAIGIAKALATAETVAQAHGVGLSVHVWTFRAENEFLRTISNQVQTPQRTAICRRKSSVTCRAYRWFFHRFSCRGRTGQGRLRSPFAVNRGRDHISAAHPVHQPLTDTSLPANKLQGR